MGAFNLISGMASSSYEAVVGFPVASTTDFATTTLHVFYGVVGSFFVYDSPGVIAYGLIALILMVPIGVVAFYKRV